MSNKAWISVGVFLALVVLVVVTREDRVAVGIRSLELPSIDTAAVEKIEVSGKHQALLEKGSDGWTVASLDKPEKKLAVEETAVTSALDALKELEAGNFVTGRASKHEELEIGDDKGLVVTLTEKGKAPLTLVFGRAAQGGGNYVRLKGSDEVFVGKGRFASTVQKDVSAWRKKKLFSFEQDDVASVVVQPAASEPYGLEAREETEGEGESKTTKTVWGFSADVRLPDGFRTDEELLRRVATTAASLRAADFVDEDKPGSETGLGDPPAAGRVVLKAKDGKTVAVRFGKEDDNKRVYAQIEGEPQVYLLQSYQTNNVLKPLDGLRDLALARFSANDVERVVLTSGRDTVEAVKKDGTWTLVQPASPPAGFEFDPGRVDGMLGMLARLKAQERLPDAPAGHGTDAPSTTVTMTLPGGATKTIAFGSDVPGEEGGRKVYVKGAEEDVVYVVPQHHKARFEKPLELVKKLPPPPAPPPGHGAGGGIPGMENLPPEVRKKLEESLRQQGMPGR